MKNPAGPPGPPPRGLRVFTWAMLVLSALVSCGSAQDLGVVLNTAAIERPSTEQLGPLADPELVSALHAMAEAQVRALRSMRVSRIAILFGLSVFCGLGLVSSLRLFRPMDLPLEAVRKLITFAAVSAAVLRTLDGAQAAVAYRRASTALVEATAHLPSPFPENVASVALVGASALWTALVAGSFALLAGYFGSARVRSWTAK